MVSKEKIIQLLEWMRGEPIRDFVRKPEEWDDYTEFVDREKICKNPLVSCCVFTYNQEQWIRQCLESIVCQKADIEYEVQICEDCSTDGTLAICREFQERYPEKVRIVHANRNYYQGALNFRRGYAMARGKYIAICEGDDYWCNERKIQLQANVFESDPTVTICYTNFKLLFGNRLSVPMLSESFIENCRTKYTQEDFVREDFPEPHSFFATASIMVKREPLLEFRFNGAGKAFCTPGDYPLHMYMAIAGRPIVLGETCAVYRKNVGVTRDGSARRILVSLGGLYWFTRVIYEYGERAFLSEFWKRMDSLLEYFDAPYWQRYRIVVAYVRFSVMFSRKPSLREVLFALGMLSPVAHKLPRFRRWLLRVRGRDNQEEECLRGGTTV